MKILGYLLIAFFFTVTFWSCEKEKSGIVDPSLNTPRLLSATVDKSVFNLDSSDTHIVSLPERQFEITLSINALISAQYNPGAVKNILYTVLLARSNNSIESGSIDHLTRGQPITDSSFWVRGSGSISFQVNYAIAGIYHINLTATDADNAMSNSIILPITITRRNIKPQLSDLQIPDTVNIPSSGRNVYLFTVAAFDSDGHDDIYRVFFYSIDPPSSKPPVEMYDDGDTPADGDQVAGDGIFSARVQIESSNHPGSNLFLFRAQDTAGALSDSLTHKVIIVK